MLPPQRSRTTRLPVSSAKLAGKTGGERRRGGPFDDAFFQFDDAKDGERDFFLADDDGLVGMRLRDRESVARRPARSRDHRRASDWS